MFDPKTLENRRPVDWEGLWAAIALADSLPRSAAEQRQPIAK